MPAVTARAIIALLVLIGAPLRVAAGQVVARYAVTSDTLRYELQVPFAVVWIRGADTIPGPALKAWQLESHVWYGASTRPELLIRSEGLDGTSGVTVDSFALEPNGRVLSRNGAAPRLDDWIDVLPRLSSSEARVGLVWGDTVMSRDTTVPAGRRYRNVRRYQVERIVDTLGTRLMHVSIEGDVGVRLLFDATSWIDVAGTMIERVVFDLSRGQLRLRASSMTLAGRGVPPASSDTVAARFETSTVMELVEPGRARLLREQVRRPQQ